MLAFRQNMTAWIVMFFLVFMLAGCSSGKKVRSARSISEGELKDLPRFDMPIEVNDRVIAWIEYFQGVGRKHFEKYLRRSGRYIPLMHEILKEEKVPLDLVYISMIESGFSSQAYSRAHAVGLWQFIKSTGKIYGLKVDGWVDERRDPYKATRAAARHFRDLYEDHGDWYLAMVGYNAGPGRIKKAIRISGSRDFWKMARHRRALRAETRDYVPKFIAAAIISKMPEKFGFEDIEYEKPLEFETSTVETQTDLKVISECAGVDYETILILNPQLYRGATPPVKNYKIRLPVGKVDTFKEKYAKIPKAERIRVVRYKVKSGDTLSRIARRYGVSVRAIASANNVKSYRRLRRGKVLTIPLRGGAPVRVASSGGKGSATKKLVYHRVKDGETAGGIARRYGVGLSQLRNWNGLNRRSTIRAGQKLKVYQRAKLASRARPSKGEVKSAATGADIRHKVRSGETVGEIAERYGVSTKELMAWNAIRNPRRVRAGKTLVIKGKGKSDSPTTAVSLADLEKRELSGKKETVSTTIDVKKEYITKVYVMKSGETLGGVANRHGVTTKQLMAWNGIKNPRRVRDGTKLKIRGVPTGTAPSNVAPAVVKVTPIVKDAPVAKEEDSGTFVVYRVKSGETVGGIANRHGVTTKQIMAWNNIKNVRKVRAGSKLKIRRKENDAPVMTSAEKPDKTSIDVPVRLSSATAKNLVSDEEVIYRVRSGDTLWDIARRHKVTIAQLQRWNNLSDPSRVRPGTKLTIRRN